MKNEMPVIDVEKVIADNGLTGEDAAIVRRIVNKGALRASKPKIAYTIVEKGAWGIDDFGMASPPWNVKNPDYEGGCAAYVWRNVAFYISPKHQPNVCRLCRSVTYRTPIHVMNARH